MSVSEPFIRRPIATSLLGIALLIGGALGYWALPVTTQLPGASPDVIASLITAPLERQLGQIPSLSSMTSTSSFGVSQISLQFDLNRDIDGATQDVQAAINAAAGILPRTLPYPPTYAKVNPADAPVMTLALTSPDPRDRLTARNRPTPSPPTIRSRPPRPTSRSSLPTATARRSPSATSTSSTTGWRTIAPAAGTRARRPSSSTSSGSPAPT